MTRRPALSPVHLLKLDISGGFYHYHYHVNLSVDNIPKLGVAFPTRPREPKLAALPLVLPMGWKNSPPIFSAATKTLADLANQRIRDDTTPAVHPLDEVAEVVTPNCPLGGAPRTSAADPVPPRDPSFPAGGRPAAYIGMFVDDFVVLSQGQRGHQRVWLILLHAADGVLRPLDPANSPFRRKPISLRKLQQGDCSWTTIKLS